MFPSKRKSAVCAPRTVSDGEWRRLCFQRSNAFERRRACENPVDSTFFVSARHVLLSRCVANGHIHRDWTVTKTQSGTPCSCPGLRENTETVLSGNSNNARFLSLSIYAIRVTVTSGRLRSCTIALIRNINSRTLLKLMRNTFCISLTN